MLSLQDCLAFCDLTEDEVRAIAQHEHIPEIAAAEMGSYLARSPAGELRIKEMVRQDIRAASATDPARARALKLVLHGFLLRHRCCESRHQPRETLS